MGASDFMSLSMDRGKRTPAPRMESITSRRQRSAGRFADVASAVDVSPMMIAYDTHPTSVLKEQIPVIRLPDLASTTASHAPRYVVVPVAAHARPTSAKQYAETAPRSAMRPHAGAAAPLAVEYAATPAGRLRTPAPTMFLARFRVDCVTLDLLLVAPPLRAAADRGPRGLRTDTPPPPLVDDGCSRENADDAPTATRRSVSCFVCMVGCRRVLSRGQ